MVPSGLLVFLQSFGSLLETEMTLSKYHGQISKPQQNSISSCIHQSASVFVHASSFSVNLCKILNTSSLQLAHFPIESWWLDQTWFDSLSNGFSPKYLSGFSTYKSSHAQWLQFPWQSGWIFCFPVLYILNILNSFGRCGSLQVNQCWTIKSVLATQTCRKHLICFKK